MFIEQSPTFDLGSLSKPQIQGVCHTDGPCMVIAGAGSGKTKVITNRIAYLLQEKSVNPYNILCLTFTNKAANEMHSRVQNIIGNENLKGLWIGTFHSIFARILRKEGNRLGYTNNFSIYDSDDSISLLKSIIKELNLDINIYKPNLVLSRISKLKNSPEMVESYVADSIKIEIDHSESLKMLPEIFYRYSARCLKADAMDFDDILINTYKILRKELDVLDSYTKKFNYIMVDEFQDTNFIQYAIIKLLSKAHKNLFIVGDDAQSIYKFRGADINNILSFKKDYPDAITIKLEQNYRSTQHIVKAANSVIAKNKNQLPKDIWTSNELGDKVFVVNSINDIEEAVFVATSISNEKDYNGLDYESFVVLYRTNSQSRILEETFRKRGIPYKIFGGLSFYQRKEIKDSLAYLRLLVNPKDDEALKRVINVPKRGIGNSTVEKIQEAAISQGRSIWEILINENFELKPGIKAALDSFVKMIKEVTEYANSNDVYKVASKILADSGLLLSLHQDKTIEGLSRYNNVQELLNSISVFVSTNDNPSLANFLQEVSLLTNIDEQSTDNNAKVKFMTVHSSKGLEFDYVYIIGLEEELFPSFMMSQLSADIEEERRLFYVAMTRAKKKLFLSYASSRNRFGNSVDCRPSRFISEIKPEYLLFNNNKFRMTQNQSKALKKINLKNSPSIVNDQNDLGLRQGMKVRHAKFGVGIISTLDTDNARKAEVIFDNFGKRVLLLDFAKLEIIE
jgi:DNA helicase-2/ATP-dependent DNA helicase PcrA